MHKKKRSSLVFVVFSSYTLLLEGNLPILDAFSSLWEALESNKTHSFSQSSMMT